MTDSLSASTDKLDAVLAKLEEAQAELKAVAKDAIKEAFDEYFEKYKFLGAVSWTQYTPYFNDGEPCEFSSHAAYATFASLKDLADGDSAGPNEDDGGEDWFSRAEKNAYGHYDHEARKYIEGPANENYDPRYKEAEEEIVAFLKRIPDETYRDLFGDHVQVTVTDEGVTVDDHYHD